MGKRERESELLGQGIDPILSLWETRGGRAGGIGFGGGGLPVRELDYLGKGKLAGLDDILVIHRHLMTTVRLMPSLQRGLGGHERRLFERTLGWSVGRGS